MKSVGQPFPIRIFICTENSDAFDDSAEIVTLICRLYPERIYDIISVFGGSQYDSIKITVCSCKANILRSKILFIPSVNCPSGISVGPSPDFLQSFVP